MSRIRRPETVDLPISQGDWLRVKKHLTAGEHRRIFSRMVKRMPAGESVEVDPLQVGRSQAVEYLLDWSLKDADDKLIPIRDKSADQIGDALDLLDIDSFNEIVAAVQAHDKAMTEEREAEKNARDGATLSPVISPSLVS